MTPKPSSDELLLSRIRTQLLMGFPFYGSLSMRLKLIPDYTVETACTNGTYVKFNPDYVRSLTERQAIGLLAHETFHCALAHPYRRGARDNGEFNVAADLAINPVLLDSGFELPPHVLLDNQYLGMSAEQIYAKRKASAPMQKPEPEPAPEEPQEDKDGETAPDETGAPDSDDNDDSGDTSDDSGADDSDTSDDDSAGAGSDDSGADSSDERSEDSGDTGAGSDDDASSGNGADDTTGAGAPSGGSMPGSSTGEFIDGDETAPDDSGDKPMSADDWAIASEQAAFVARAAGLMPMGADRELKRSRDAVLDWRAALREFIVQANPSDYTWTSPNRRFVSSKLYLPGTSRDTIGEIVIGIDTSGSVSQDMLDGFAAEITSIISEARPERVHVVYCDSTVQGSEEFTPDDDVKLTMHGGGGTRFAPVFDWIEENELAPRVLVYLTDLDSFDHPTEPDYPVLWVTPSWVTLDGPFGETIRLTDND